MIFQKNYYGDSAWTLEPTRNEWYLHMYHLTQPDLNYDNPQVLEELMSTLRFWLDRGVSGFRFNSVEYIFENDDGLHKTLGLLDKIRQLLKSYEARDELERYSIDVSFVHLYCYDNCNLRDEFLHLKIPN